MVLKPDCLFFRQRRWYYNPNDGVLPRRESRRTLSRVRQDLGKKVPSGKTLLLPPYVSPGEIRILLGVDYQSAISLCGVKTYQQRYFWSDSEGRQFETDNKRKIVVSFDQVAHAVKQFGLSPIMVSPEPNEPEFFHSIPVIAYFSTVPPRDSLLLHISPSFSLTHQTRLLSNSDIVVVHESCLSEYHFLGVEKPFVSTTDESNWKLPSWESNVSANHRKSTPTFASDAFRTDILVDYDSVPLCSAVVLDVEKSEQQGTVAVVLVRAGQLVLGQTFVCGSGFGKVKNIYALNGDPRKFAEPGMIVKVGKVSTADTVASPDDWLHVFPKERAWRLAFYRKRIEELNGMQTDGKKIVGNFDQQSSKSNLDESINISNELNELNDLGDSNESSKTSLDDKSILRLRTNSEGSILVAPWVESEAVSLRYTRRQEAKLRNRILEAEREQSVKQDMHRIRQLVHSGNTDDLTDKVVPITKVLPTVVEPVLPSPVIGLIVKTKSVSQFEAVMDGIEQLEKEYAVKLPMVHGGIGPVTPTDLVHAQIEQEATKSDPVPIYTVCTTSIGSSSEIVAFVSVENLLEEIRMRIVALKKRREKKSYTETIRSKIRTKN